jgi:hypothetical protein
MIKRTLALMTTAALAACSVGTAEDTNVFVRDKNADQVIIGIHISLLSHPENTHILGYNKMQRLADASCAEFGKSAARYTGTQEQKTRGNAYDTWIERTYRCA